VVEALRGVIRPVTYTTIALCLGFSTMILSDMRTQAEFGWLAAATLASAWLIDVTFTPALASRMQVVTIWDVLSLDLGSAPNESIPLFSGLTATQARVAALMTRIQSFPAGHPLFRTGQPGEEMYVVIEGELEASIEKDGRHVVLRHLARGDVIGEAGIFLGKRTADVTTTSSVRLLRFDRDALDRIARRHPRIGARLYANLSRVLADRMAHLTTRV